jgi:hypothetical protein
VRQTILILLFALPLFATSQIFIDKAPEWGITQYNWDGVFGAGATTADWNRDGWDDLTFGNSSGDIRTFVNDGGDGFTMMPLPLNQTYETKAIQWVDMDGDYDLDLYYSDRYGRIEILENKGDSAFVNMTEGSGLPQDSTEGAGAAWGDYDRDGDLDLYICRYVDGEFLNLPQHRNVLMRNDGDFQFTNVTEESETGHYGRLSFQAIWYDWNSDGWEDIYVINDKNGANSLFQNLQDGSFEEVATEVGADLVLDAMTASLGDFNQDGYQDIFMTSTVLGNDYIGSQLLVGSASGQFQEASADYGLNFVRYCWGAVWMDVDNDADLDLFVAESEFLSPYQDNFLYENPGSPYYFQQFPTSVYGTDLLNSYSVASGDFDRNGWTDFVMHNNGNHKARIWMNSGFNEAPPHYIQVGLKGQVSNTMGVGAWIEVIEDGISQRRTTHCGENYLGQESFYEHFGLGESDGMGTDVDTLRLEWTSGVVDEWYGVQDFDRPVYVEGTSACQRFDNTPITICGSNDALLEIEVLWDEAEVVWSFQETDPSSGTMPPSIFVSSETSISPVSSGFYTAAVLHQGVELCATTIEFTSLNLNTDLSENGSVGSEDLLEFLQGYGCLTLCDGDFNNDGASTVDDLLELLIQFGSSCL